MKSESYKLSCHGCEKTVEFPTRPTLDGIAMCPKCGARLEIDWAAASTEIGGSKLEAARTFEHPALVLRRAWLRELARVEQVYGVSAQVAERRGFPA